MIYTNGCRYSTSIIIEYLIAVCQTDAFHKQPLIIPKRTRIIFVVVVDRSDIDVYPIFPSFALGM